MKLAHQKPVYKTSAKQALTSVFGIPSPTAEKSSSFNELAVGESDSPKPLDGTDSGAISVQFPRLLSLLSDFWFPSFTVGLTFRWKMASGSNVGSVELTAAMNGKFDEHATMLNAIMETQSQLLAAVEQLQRQSKKT